MNVAQNEISKILGGKITFVGCIPEFDAFIVACKESTQKNQPWPSFSFFLPEEDVYGNIIIISSDEKGYEKDLDIEKMKLWLEIHFGTT